MSEAYECLSDDSRRKQYDAFRMGGGPSGGNPFGGAGSPFGSGGSWNFQSTMNAEELFRTIFGEQFGRAAGGQRPGAGDPFEFSAPPEYQMRLTFLEAARGVEKELAVRIMDNCGTCKGSGCQPGTSPDR